MGTEFCCLATMDMVVDTRIRGFQIICNITKVNKYFLWDLNFLDCPTHEKHEVKCPMNKKSFTGSLKL